MSEKPVFEIPKPRDTSEVQEREKLLAAGGKGKRDGKGRGGDKKERKAGGKKGEGISCPRSTRTHGDWR